MLTTTDYPLSYSFDEINTIEFKTISEYKHDATGESRKYYTNDKNYKIKFPVRAFHRTNESFEERLLEGTFYEVENTHQVPFEVFVYCMAHKDVGIIGFYLYAYLKHRNDIFKLGIDISHVKLSQETGILPTKIDECLKRMKIHNMISVIVQDFVFDLPIHLRKANRYAVKGYNVFGEGKGNVKTRKVYQYVEGQANERMNAYIEEYLVAEDLPF